MLSTSKYCLKELHFSKLVIVCILNIYQRKHSRIFIADANESFNKRTKQNQQIALKIELKIFAVGNTFYIAYIHLDF